MFTMSPNDNRLSNPAGEKVGDFGGNRKVTSNIQKAEDYKKPSLQRRANLDGTVEEVLIEPDATIDVDDLNDPQNKKRETSRRAETSHVGADNQYRRPGDGDDKIYSDSDHRTKPDTRSDDAVVEPDSKAKHGTRNVHRFGEDRRTPGSQNLGPENQ
jgi:hypothetical protein